MGIENKSVLIIDDDDALLFAFRKIFNGTGITIEIANSIEDAKKQLVEENFSLVITDLRLQNVHKTEGVEIIRFIREHCPETKTILWTAYGSSEIEKEIEQAHPDYYLKKPVPSEKISHIMEEIGLFK